MRLVLINLLLFLGPGLALMFLGHSWQAGNWPIMDLVMFLGRSVVSGWGSANNGSEDVLSDGPGSVMFLFDHSSRLRLSSLGLESY